MVAELFAAPRIPPGGLQMAARVGADPDILPGRRDRQRANPGERLRIANLPAIRPKVGKSLVAAAPQNAGLFVAYVMQPGLAGVGLSGIHIGLDASRPPAGLTLSAV
jgi:hypothetical protein